MNRSLGTNVGLAVLVAAAGAWLWLRPPADPAGQQEFPVGTLTSAQATSVRVWRPGAPDVVLERRDRGWRQTAPVAARTDTLRVERVLEVLSARARTRLPAQELERFDLQAPVARLTVNGQVLAFGAVNPVTGEQYLLSGEHVFLVRPAFGQAIPPPGETLASSLLLGEDETPVAFDLPGRRVEQREGRWTGSPPAGDAGSLSQDDYQRWADRWRFASSLATVPAPAQPRGEKIAVTLADGRRLELLARDDAGGFVLVRLDERLEYRFAAEQRARLLGPPAAPGPR